MLFNTITRVKSYHILHTSITSNGRVYRCCMAVAS